MDIRGKLTVDVFPETKPESTDPWSVLEDSWEDVSARESSAMLNAGCSARGREEINDLIFKLWANG
jgi:hypothetical protein